MIKIFVFSDALGYEIVKKYSVMHDRLKFAYQMETQFGYSSTAVPSILCGKTAREHGHFSFFYFDREKKSPFRFFRWIHCFMHPDFVFKNHRVRHKISRFLKKIFGFTGYFNLYCMPFNRLPYFDYCEKNDIFAPGGLKPCPNINDVLSKTKLNYHISNWRNSDDDNIQAASDYMTENDADFVFIYTAKIDGMLHFHVNDEEFVRKYLKEFEVKINHLIDVAQAKYKDVDFYLFSDHGMTPLTYAVDLKSKLEAVGAKFGKDYVVTYDSTMLRLWILNEKYRKKLMDSMQDQPGHWLSADEKKNWGVDFENNKYGDEMFLLDPGIQLCPSDMGTKPIPGMHGFAPDDKDSIACLMSINAIEQPPRVLPGMFDLMKKEIDALERAKNNG